MTTTIQKAFFSSPLFAVVGASKVQAKYGTRVLRWYQARQLPVQPVHHREYELEGLKTVKSIADLAAPTRTSISIITPPNVTLGILKAAKDLGVPALWLQPGAEDPEVVKYIKESGLADRVVYGGPCVLRDGDGIRSLL